MKQFSQKDLFWILTLVSEELNRKRGVHQDLSDSQDPEERDAARSTALAIFELECLRDHINHGDTEPSPEVWSPDRDVFHPRVSTFGDFFEELEHLHDSMPIQAFQRAGLRRFAVLLAAFSGEDEALEERFLEAWQTLQNAGTPRG